jgi:predicted transcriptional regulator
MEKIMEKKVVEITNRNNLYGFEQREPDLRRAPSQEKRASYDIKQLWQKNHEILMYALVGMKHEEIAKMVGVTPKTVSNTVNSSLGQNKLSEMRIARDANSLDVAAEVTKMYGKALKVYEEILDGEGKNVSPSLRKQTADTILMDIGGHRAPTKIDTRNAHMHMTTEELEELKSRGKAAAKACGMMQEEE